MVDYGNLGMLEDDDEDEKPEEKASTEPMPSMIEKSLFKARTVLIFGEINQKLARDVTAKLLAIASEGTDPITVIINSQGGHVEAGDTIHDMLKFVGPSVRIIGTGWVASAAAHIFIAGTRENRLCLPNTRFMIHQPMGGVRGPATDIGIEAREIVKIRQRMNRTIARETGQPLERVEVDTDRNFWMSAEEAKEYGLVSRVIDKITEI